MGEEPSAEPDENIHPQCAYSARSATGDHPAAALVALIIIRFLWGQYVVIKNLMARRTLQNYFLDNYAKHPIFTAFMDLAKAFDSVNHQLLWGKLTAMGLSTTRCYAQERMIKRGGVRKIAIYSLKNPYVFNVIDYLALLISRACNKFLHWQNSPRIHTERENERLVRVL